MTDERCYDAVRTAVAAALPRVDSTDPAAVHAYLWPYVQRAVRDFAGDAASAPPRDRRSKAWQYHARVWQYTGNGPELVAQMDAPEIMHGTGRLPQIVEDAGLALYDRDSPEELSVDHVKTLLPTLRNNLGRNQSAVLRIDYEVAGERYMMQVDVHRLDSAGAV